MAQKHSLEYLTVQVEGLDFEGNKLGSGAYGVVYDVSVSGRQCIAKKLHNALHQTDIDTTQRSAIEDKFRNECYILSTLNHKNIVQFVGVHFGHDKSDLSLVMEKLHTDLCKFVEKKPNTPMPVRLSILRDVACGLLYLHTLTPPLIHRDLTAPNILLTENATQAKIGDMGVSRYVDPNFVTKLTACPGNAYYMPPEALHEHPIYTMKLDIFSYGNLIVHTISGKMPKVYRLAEKVRRQYSDEGQEELMRRRKSIHDNVKIGTDHCVYPLVVRCLYDNPDRRPNTEEVYVSLKDLCKRYPRYTLYQACERGKAEHVRVFLRGGADPNQTNESGQTVLYIASKNRHDDIVEMLIAAMASPNLQTNNGWTALIIASYNGHERTVEILLASGCDIDLQTNSGRTALWTSSNKGHEKIVQRLITAGANVDIQDENGFTALHVASQEGRHKIVQILLLAKPLLDLQTNNGRTALCVASYNGHERVVEILLESGCDVDMQSNFNYTPLMVAAQEGHVSVVSLLLSKGADVTIKSKSGDTAYKLASMRGHQDICRLLPHVSPKCNIV